MNDSQMLPPPGPKAIDGSLNRRQLVRGAAWAVPAVTLVTPIPAYAASYCIPQEVTIDWASAVYNPNTQTVTMPFPEGLRRPGNFTLEISTSFGGNTQAGNQAGTSNQHLRVSPFPVGGTSMQGLTIHQSPIQDWAKQDGASNANTGITTFTFKDEFGAPLTVSNLSFTVTDIDARYRDFADGVYLTSAQSSPVYTPSAFLSGNGMTAPSAYKPMGWWQLNDSTDAQGNLGVSFTSVSEFNLYYQNRTASYHNNIDGDQSSYLTSFVFTIECI